MSAFVQEPARQIPVVGDFDLCVVGGSCTGVFAAVRATRLGLSVALIERNILFGGMATAAQVNEWHSLWDAAGKRQIIGGLTVEMIERLRERGAVRDHTRNTGKSFRFNSAELALLLDELVTSHEIQPFLQASCVGAIREEDRLVAAVIEDKSGRRAVRARFFIDASGDGDLLRKAGFEAWQDSSIQPVSYQMLVSGLGSPEEAGQCWRAAKAHAADFEYPLANAHPWFVQYPSAESVLNVFGARMNGVDASDADSLTRAILEARRRQRALLSMLQTSTSERPQVIALAQALGVRETWHGDCLHRLMGEELLSGVNFPDSIALGSYPVDIHSDEGTLLRYLDGRETLVRNDGSEVSRRWRSEDSMFASYYQIPFRSLLPRNAENLLVAGRLIDADRQAFGAIRVMVTMNQTGEAAGVAAALCMKNNCKPEELPPEKLRNSLIEGGSLLN